MKGGKVQDGEALFLQTASHFRSSKCHLLLDRGIAFTLDSKPGSLASPGKAAFCFLGCLRRFARTYSGLQNTFPKKRAMSHPEAAIGLGFDLVGEEVGGDLDPGAVWQRTPFNPPIHGSGTKPAPPLSPRLTKQTCFFPSFNRAGLGRKTHVLS